MNINQKVISALTPLGMPISPSHYDGGETDYIVFNYADERDDICADNTVLTDITSIQVHYFTKGNPQENKKKIRKALRNAGFVDFSTSEFYEDDTKYNHIVVECSIYGEIDEEVD